LQPSARRDFAVKHLTPGIGRSSEVEMVKGQGSWVSPSNNHTLYLASIYKNERLVVVDSFPTTSS
jgi:hypothetical protein